MTRLIPNTADDHRGRFSKIIRVAVAIAGALVLVLAGCSNPAQSDDGGGSGSGSGAGEAIPEQEAVEALIAVLQARNLVPQRIDSARLADPSGPGPSAEDYVSTDIDSEGDRELTLYVDAEGDLVPSAEWQSANSNYCANDNRYLKAPVKLIKIKTYGVSDGYYAFAQYIDIATGRIEEQREGQAAELQDAIDQAWGGIETPVGPASDPCGAGRSYDITFEVTGSYTPQNSGGSGPTAYTLLVTYGYATASQGPIVVQEYDPALPFSETVTVEAGTGVTLGAVLLDTGSVTYTLKQNGTVIESHQYGDVSQSYTIDHTVGQ
jgi:hypothetical protein